jgi:hypothetical protein
VLCILFFSVSCERENLYDIASGKSRTAYAIAYDGAQYALLIANQQFIKQYPVIPPFEDNDIGISVNKHNDEIIAFQINYTYSLQNNLINWNTIYITSPNYAQKVIAYKEGFISFNFDLMSHVHYFKTGSTSWEYLSSNPNSNILSCFQSYDGQAYLLGYDSSIFYVYKPSVFWPRFIKHFFCLIYNSFLMHR